MKVWGNYECEGQMSMFDLYGQDFLYGRTYQEPSVPTKGKTLDAYSKKFAELRIKMPQYLCLKKENGVQADASWDQESSEYIQWLGKYTMHSFGECPREENASRLSQILEVNPLPKYSLSPKACQGILRRAENRGKELPPQLKEALIRQSAFKNEPDVVGGGKGILIQHERTGALSTLNNQSVLSIDEKMGQTLTSGRNDTHSIPTVYGISGYESNAMKSSNPHSGIYEAETTRTLDLNGGNPACNQGGMIVLEGNGSRDSHKGDGYRESETMYTLNTVEQHGVCQTYQKTTGALTPGAHPGSYNGQDAYNDMLVVDDMPTCGCDDQTVTEQTPRVYGLDRASFNQGKNAQYDFQVQEEIAQTIVAKGPGGVLTHK